MPESQSHSGLPVDGYTDQSTAKVTLVNEFKQDEERLVRKTEQSYGTHGFELDHHWAAIARTHFQEGFMALNRSVFQPRRIGLPEDVQAKP